MVGIIAVGYFGEDFFNGKDTFHTDLQAFGDSSPRYTLNIFYGEKVYG